MDDTKLHQIVRYFILLIFFFSLSASAQSLVSIDSVAPKTSKKGKYTRISNDKYCFLVNQDTFSSQKNIQIFRNWYYLKGKLQPNDSAKFRNFVNLLKENKIQKCELILVSYNLSYVSYLFPYPKIENLGLILSENNIKFSYEILFTQVYYFSEINCEFKNPSSVLIVRY